MTKTPFDDIRELINRLPSLDGKAARQAEMRLRGQPDYGAHLGTLGEALIRWSAIRGQTVVAPARPVLIVFAATHGCAADRGREADRLAALAAGGMPVNFLCGDAGVGLKAFELALNIPTPDIRLDDALSERDCAATIAFGMEALAGEPDVVLLTAAGEGGDLAARAVIASLHEESSEFWADSEPDLAAVLGRIEDGPNDPLTCLRRVGGRDIAALTGAILAARAQQALVILDGLPAIAAAFVLQALDPDAARHVIVAAGDATPIADPDLEIAPDGIPGLPIPEDTPVIACSAGEGGYGAVAVLAFVQLKFAANVLARAPSADQLGVGA